MRSNKKVALIVAAVAALLVLVAGTSLAVTAIQNSRNLASQRAAAAAVHHRAVIAHDKAAAAAKDKATAQAIARANRRAAKAEKAAKAAARAPTVVVVPAAPAGPAGLIYAGVGENGEAVYANSNTSSSFALNVEAAYVEGGYWYDPNISQFYAYSPTTGQDYFMTSSSAGNPVVVTGGNGALVQFDF
jgi:hypothetical protein